MLRSYFLQTVAVMLFVLASISYADAAPKKPTDTQIKKAIIKESIANYPGNCPCPYSVARNGSGCGRRSAYSKPGGYSPICYESDVTNEMIKEWRERQSPN